MPGEDAVVGEQTYEPHAKWSSFTGQHPQGQKGRSLPDVSSYSETLEVLGASDNPSRTALRFLGCGSTDLWPLSLLTQPHKRPPPPRAEHPAGGTMSSDLVLPFLSQCGTVVGSWSGEMTQPSSCQGERSKNSPIHS